MYLSSLTINGFKSFAKKSELEFTASITAIVGPNGSGKSNVAESFRFVLGEQSVKSLRGKKGEDLIWGGSPQVARGNRAQVEVVLDNTKRTFALDFDEVKIERIVHRDGQNEYKLNGSAVRLKDIQELLAAANIGPTGHHIISQGEADRVLSAGGRERREMIEDALGLKVYQLKKQESTRKLEKTQENIAQVESLRREAAPHLKYLKKQMERAEEARAVQTELTTVYAEYLKREDVYLAHHYDRLQAERRTPAARLADVQTEIAHAKASLTRVTETHDTDAFAAAERAVSEAAKARQAAEQVVAKCQGQIDLLERRVAAARRAAANVATATVSRQELVGVVDDIAQAVEKALAHGGEERIRRALSDLVHQLRVFLERTDNTPRTEDDEAELEVVRQSLHAAQVALTTASAAETEAKARFTAAQAAVSARKDESHEAERRVYELIAEQRELSVTVADIDRELALLARDRDDFKRELQEAVTLLGRGASQYFTFEVVDTVGQPVPHDVLVSEDRTIQRERQRALEKLKIRLEALGIGEVASLVKEYEDAVARDEFLAREIADLTQSMEKLHTLIGELEAKIAEQFEAGIAKISTEFNHFFTLMFGGGSAALTLVKLKRRGEAEDVDDALEESVEVGVELAVKLPNKRVSGLEMLSGGERALTSIALIFAMSQVNPPPFIILDETDAALDEANSRRYGDMIEALAQKSQLILITHNRETMSRAGILYGITMGADGVSKLLSVKFDDAVAVAK
jgi:chromosome segregation protein